MTNQDMRRKGQLQIGETIFILIIFFILLILGLIFYSQVEMSSISKTNLIDSEREILKSAIEVIYFPEISCMGLTKEMNEGCFDLYKLEAFTALSADSDYNRTMRLVYFDKFGDSEVVVRIVFPQGDSRVFTIFNKTIDSVSTKKTFIPVVVKDPLNDINYFAYLEIKTAKR